MKRRDIILATLAASASGFSSAEPAKNAILVVGDSISAEYGLKRGSGWVALLESKLVEEKRSAVVRNASISGDTTSGGRSRLPGLLKDAKPGIVVIELGGNDALRGLPLQMTRDNLLWMTEAAQQAGAKVLLLGMQVPPNYGADYGKRFADSFIEVAQLGKASVVPFLLKGIADGPDPLAMFQADRIHPREQAQPLMLANVWPELKRLLK